MKNKVSLNGPEFAALTAKDGQDAADLDAAVLTSLLEQGLVIVEGGKVLRTLAAASAAATDPRYDKWIAGRPR